MTFDDPQFLQSLGRVTISFSLLEGTLAALIDWFDGPETLDQIARMPFSSMVECFITRVRSDFRKYRALPFDEKSLRDLKAALKSVGAERNRLMHDYWTIEVESQRVVLKGLKANSDPDRYPTPDRLQAISDRIYAVRSQLGPIVNGYLAARRLHSEGQRGT